MKIMKPSENETNIHWFIPHQECQMGLFSYQRCHFRLILVYVYLGLYWYILRLFGNAMNIRYTYFVAIWYIFPVGMF
jgi:hypothetical protein